MQKVDFFEFLKSLTAPFDRQTTHCTGLWHIESFSSSFGTKNRTFRTKTLITHFPDFLIDGFYNLYNTDFQTTKETHRVHKASICTISFMKRLHFE